MEINDETVLAYIATRDLLRLYDAYRATTRAQIAATQQIRRHRFPPDTQLTEDMATELSALNREESLFWHTDAVYGLRRNQMRQRLFEILDIPVLS